MTIHCLNCNKDAPWEDMLFTSCDLCCQHICEECYERGDGLCAACLTGEKPEPEEETSTVYFDEEDEEESEEADFDN